MYEKCTESKKNKIARKWKPKGKSKGYKQFCFFFFFNDWENGKKKRKKKIGS